MPASPQQSLERYVLLDRIAVGGMAEVFRAKAYGAHGFEKTLAIKRILPELARDPEFEERFIGEAKLAVKLTHANVVQVFDFGRTAGTLFIAMEYVDGLDLAALLKLYRDRGENVPIPAAFHMAVEIARGLGFAHQHGVVHRDVSPSNILLSRAGEVKIADFGIALAADKASSERRRIMGKWRYMSPEQTGGDPVGTRSDLFSAASVMFEIFTGEKLFPGDEAEEIIRNIHDMEIPRPSERRPGLPPRLDAVLARALERDPEKRWEKSAEMLRALIEVSYDSSIVATALDVSEAVGEVLAPALEHEEADGEASRGIDDLIQAQLRESEGRAPTQRRTAVGEEPEPEGEDRTQTATMVRRGVDSDGVTIWEYDEETVAAGPAAKRRTGSERAIDDEEAAALEAGAARREEEAGEAEGAEGEPAGGASPGKETAPAGARVVEAAARTGQGAPRRIGFAVAVAAAAMAVAGAGAFYLFGGKSGGGGKPLRPAPLASGASDAAGAQPIEPAVLDVASAPPGAHVRVDGEPAEGTTPLQVEVRPGESHRIEVSLEGYRTATDEVVPQPGERIRIRSPLVALQAGLTVKTRPPGATVLLDGEEIGVTPLERDDLRPGRGRRLVLRKKDYHSIELKVDLVTDEQVTVSRRLKSSVRWGEIDLRIVDSWADVSLGGDYIGRAPARLRLPVGHHRLRLTNSETGKKGWVDVNVYEDRVATYTAHL